jgi:hypothetical protein
VVCGYFKKFATLSIKSFELEPPAPSPARTFFAPPPPHPTFDSRAGGTLAFGKGGGGANSDEGTDTLVL